MEFDDLKCFLTIFKHLSITKASLELGLSKTAVSKKLDSLEWKLGFKLFNRNTRQMRATEKALILIPEVELILNKVKNLNSFVEKERTLRITAPVSMVNSFLGEILFNYKKEFPKIKIDLVASDILLDFLEKGIDLSIRINPRINSSLIGKKIGNYSLMAVVRKDYQKKIPKNIDEIIHFETIFIEKHKIFFQDLSSNAIEKIDEKRSFFTNDSRLVHEIIKNNDIIGIRANWDLSDFKVILKKEVKSCGDIWLLRNPYNEYNSDAESLFIFLEKILPFKF